VTLWSFHAGIVSGSVALRPRC